MLQELVLISSIFTSILADKDRSSRKKNKNQTRNNERKLIRHDLQRVLKVLEFHFDALKSLKTIQTTCLGEVLSLEFHFFFLCQYRIKTWNHYSVVRMNFTSNKYCNIPFLYCWPGCLKCVFHETSFDDSYGKSVKRSLKVWKVWSRPMFCLKSFTMLTYLF